MKTVAFLYVFLFACLLKAHATTPVKPQPKQQQQPKDCVKHPQIVKARVIEKPKAIAERSIPTTHVSKGGNAIPHFSVLNFINFFYSKDTLDNLRVM